MLSWERESPREEPIFRMRDSLESGFAVWEEGDGVIHLIQLLHNPNQGQAVTTHQVRPHSWGIRNHQIKVKEVVVRVWAILVGLAGGLRCQWGRGRGLRGW